ncbi:hypothetical protein K7B06_01360 [Streptomyces erythrochromogenes]|nr:hypothetical protein [Streptomyces erythrochromogenes]
MGDAYSPAAQADDNGCTDATRRLDCTWLKVSAARRPPPAADPGTRPVG